MNFWYSLCQPLSVTGSKHEIWTTIIKGDLDSKQNGVFESIVKKFEIHMDDINAGYRHYNRNNAAYGTHARLLLVATLMTRGNILELGAGDHSTKLFHEILEDDNLSGERLLVSAESDAAWLERFRNLSTSFHQLLWVDSCKITEYS